MAMGGATLNRDNASEITGPKSSTEKLISGLVREGVHTSLFGTAATLSILSSQDATAV